MVKQGHVCPLHVQNHSKNPSPISNILTKRTMTKMLEHGHAHINQSGYPYTSYR